MSEKIFQVFVIQYPDGQFALAAPNMRELPLPETDVVSWRHDDGAGTLEDPACCFGAVIEFRREYLDYLMAADDFTEMAICDHCLSWFDMSRGPTHDQYDTCAPCEPLR